MAFAHTLSSDRTLVDELPTPSFVPIRYRPGNLGTWSGHLAFANDLIAALRPSLIVELGTHWGESYFTFCQSVFQNGLEAVCYAVDHWLGEAHAGLYGAEVFQDVQSFNESHYRGFSYLLRMSFDDALLQFANNSIELLHIDGLHTYEAASHDFRSWFPKVKPGGIILLHDVAVRHADFGVWRLWDELKSEFSETFTFHHWWGLGVLRKPGGDCHSPFLDLLFKGSTARAEQLRRHYVMYTVYMESTREGGTKPTPAKHDGDGPRLLATPDSHAKVQVFPFGSTGYAEESSVIQPVGFNQWEDLSFSLAQGTGNGPLRIDPSDCVSVIEIRSLTLSDDTTGTVLFTAQAPEEFQNLSISDTALRFSGNAPCSILSYAEDPFITLPNSARSDGGLRLEISIRVLTTAVALAAAFKSAHSDIQRLMKEEGAGEIARLQEASSGAEARASESQMRVTEAERQTAESRAQIEQLENSLASATMSARREAQREVRILQELMDAAEDRTRELGRQLAVVPDLEKQLQQTREMLESERAMRALMLRSKSWTLTKPLREVINALKR